jgi:hypothetical protein
MIVPTAPPFSSKVMFKAIPAIIMIALIFISMMLVADQTESLPLVILLWIVVPFMVLYVFRKLRTRFSG